MINPNVRAITLQDNQAYKISVNRSLCTHCGLQKECMARKVHSRFGEKYSVVSLIKECTDYVYPLLFQSEEGTRGEFNTIRLGAAWIKRLKVGDRVALISKSGDTFAFAKVTMLANGDKNEILLHHAYKNHLYVNKNISQKEAGESLIKRLPSIYGNLIVKNNEEATVIYLEN